MSAFVALLESLATMAGAKFASFVYVAQPSGPRLTVEVARHLLILGASTENLYRRDLETLAVLMPTLTGLQLAAAEKIRASRTESLDKGVGNNSAYTGADAYAPTAIKGVKVHLETGNLHISGLTMRKDVIVKANYRTVNSKPETIARQEVEAMLPSAKFRQFRLDGVTVAKLNGDTLEVSTATDIPSLIASGVLSGATTATV
jgi:hypothetical protein